MFCIIFEFLRNTWQKIQPFLSDLNLADLTFSDYVWARTIVQTRSFTINKNSKSMTALIPMADMLNHQ